MEVLRGENNDLIMITSWGLGLITCDLKPINYLCLTLSFEC